MKRLALGIKDPSSVQFAKGERKWLFAYAPLSAAYRIFISAVIVLWIGAQSLMLGVVAAVFVITVVLVKPTVTATSQMLAAIPAGGRRWRARAVVASALSAFLILLCLVPVPFYTPAQGVVWLPEQAHVRPETDGFVTKFLVRDGEHVETGQVLLVIDDPALFAAREKLTSQLEQFKADRFDLLFRDPVRAQNAEEEITRVQGDLRRIEQRIGQLEVRSQLTGTLVMPRQQDLPGMFARQGKTLGYVLDHGQIGVRAAVPEHDGALVRERTRAVDVRIADAPGERLVAELVRDVPAATHELPSPALGDRGGGPYVTDPADKDALHTLEPIVLIDLKLPAKTLERVGGRAWVRFDHGAEPLASQWYRRLRQLFLQHFNPTG